MFADTVRNTALIERFVQLAFPEATARPSTRADWARESAGSSEPDYFRNDSSYFEVIGKPYADELSSATGVLADRPVSHRRLVQVKVISLRAGSSREPVYAAFLNYTFLEIERCNQCKILANVALIHRGDGIWRTETAPLAGPNLGISAAAFTDLSGDAMPDLLIEAEGGVNAWSETTLYVFDVTANTLNLLSECPIRYDSTNSGFDRVKFDKKLDIAKSRATGGNHLVFRVTAFTLGNAILSVPRITEALVPMKRAAR